MHRSLRLGRCRKNLPLSVTVTMISHAEFRSTLIETFPEMEADVRDEDGLLHLEMSVFSRFTQNAIDTSDVQLLDRYFEFADNLFRNADDAVKNAVYVSYLEHLNCTDGKSKRAWALKRMSPTLLAGFNDINEYNARIHGRTP